MLTDQQLVDKARNAIEHYQRVYGRYPLIVGIDAQRLKRMQTTQIAFPELKRELPSVFWHEGFDPLDMPMPEVHMEIVGFVPYAGGKPDEVYMSHTTHRKGVSGAAIARLLRIVEMRRKRAEEAHHRYARYFNPMVLQGNYRMGPLLADNED